VLYDGRSRIKLSDGTMVYQYGTVASNAQYSVVPESCAIKIRDDMPLDRAALIGCSVMTGVGAVLNTARVPAGKSLAVFGTGGIGLNAIQGGRIANAYPLIAVDVADNKLEYAHEMGATHTINGSRQNVQEEITRITGRGVEYAIVAVGSSKAIEQAWSCLARGGTCVVVGMPSTGDTFSLDVRGTLVGMERRLVGSSYGSAQTRIDFPRMVDLYMTGKLKIDELVTRRFKMEEANEAYDALARGELARGLILFD
jgi:S-(hydroxymethyl)glutathione dehydrogenase/alcohol dehydrogenase